MKLELKKPSKSLNKAYYKQSLSREQIELFKKELQNTFNHIDEKQDEEYHKNVIADLFKNVYCKDKYLVNVNKKEDLVIRTGNNTADAVGVLLEFKKPTEKRDMVSASNANVKALQEVILYYLRQTIDNDNHKIINLVVTNIYEWFIFDGVWFEKNVFRNSKLKKEYLDFKTSGHDTKYFYDTIAAKFLATFTDAVPCTYINLLDYKKIIADNNPSNDSDLIDLYKILSPEHLLNKKFANDSNSLNTDFYNELLYIVGLEESKETAKKTIRRINEAERNEGSLIENTIAKLKIKKYFGYDNNEQTENQYYEVALELCITWLNRILFLKLLESQLIKYHRGDAEKYSFLTSTKIKEFDDLEELFFEVLAEKVADRKPSVATKYKDIPYLNSSLFEMTDLEKNALALSNLKDRLEFEVYKKSVLKKATKEVIKPKTSLNYLLDFLDAYNFASESNAKIQEENKSIINAAVLGLIFEKINGYKDGSFFTPGFITMYMCRETIRKAVVEKFKTNFANCQEIIDFDDLKDKIDYTNKTQRLEANKLINDIKIVDPAVGSGHFLVSALNEMIAIKSELQILSYKNQNRVLGYTITLDNDELIIQNQETDKLFEYTLNQNNNIIAELQDLQECLFTEKQTIIENCLFGVDINPKSVMICQLRLWIELLKNAYYTNESTYKELHTLPNIDINIKTGNSLISKFAIKDNVFEHIAGFQKKLQEYKTWVSIYKSTNDKKAKDVLKKNLKLFKDDFKLADLRVTKLQNDLRKLNGNYYDKYQTHKMFSSELSTDELAWKQKLEAEILAKQIEIQTVKDNPIYIDAFEWRFEFPEVLDDNGGFVGFDVVIGNPPYITILLGKNKTYNISESDYYKLTYKTFEYKGNTYVLFIEKANQILKQNGLLNYIIPNTILLSDTYSYTRNFLLAETNILELINCDFKVFEEAEIGGTLLLMSEKNNINHDNNIEVINFKNRFFEHNDFTKIKQSDFNDAKSYKFYLDNTSIQILNKSNQNSLRYGSLVKIYQGIITGDNKKFISTQKIDSRYQKIIRGKDINNYSKEFSGNFLLFDKSILWSNTDETNFYKAKIISRQTSDTLIGAFDDENYLTLDSTHVHTLIDSNFDLKFLLSLFNSKFLRFLYKLMVQEEGRVFAQVKAVVLKELPIKNISLDFQQPFISLVDQILTLKKENPKADTSALENDIDELVYKLYDLTPEEVEVVKGS